MDAVAVETEVPEIELRRPRESYEALMHRLSVQSVKKHYDAYADVDWDSDAMRIDPSDPRFELKQSDSLGATSWYQAQPQDVRAKLGLNMTVDAMKVGVAFENILQRGLLEFAAELPNNAPEFRYAYHEVIEEGHHSLMFQEFVNRSGFDPRGLSASDKRGARWVARLGRVFPELFFFFVLGGEEPIDHAQKRSIRSGKDIHPLVRRIMQIHITEEARHLCFARTYLQARVPTLGFWKKLRLAIAVPVILGTMARMMLEPSRTVIRRYGIPSAVVREAYHDNPEHKAAVRESLRGVAKLCIELGLLDRRSAWWWRQMGLGNPLRYA